jgi:surface carbohydrate biosynthesis protein
MLKNKALVFQSLPIRVYVQVIKKISWLINVRFRFETITKSDIVIFEKVNEDYLIPLCENFSYRLLDINLNNPQINFKISLNTLKYILFFNSIKSSYLAALIEQINPKTVITFIDNSDLFYSVSRILHKHIFFLAIQNASRYDILELPNSKSKKIHIPNFACFGKNEVDIYTKKNAIVENFIPLGSLRDSYYRNYISKKKNRSSSQYDICIVAEASPGWDTKYPGYEDATGKIAQYAVKYCKERDLKIVIAGKRDLDFARTGRAWFQTAEAEAEWYERYIGDSVKITPRVGAEYTTYDLVDRSRLSLAMVSTSLSEGASRGNRVLFCNFSKHSVFDFPVKGFMSLTDDSYELFSDKVSEILSYSDEEYNDKVSSTANYIMNSNNANSTYDALKKIISNSVNNKRQKNVK